MGARVYVPTAYSGYGVDGEILIPSTDIAGYDFADITAALPYNPIRGNPSNPTPIARYVVMLQWRFKFVVNDANIQGLQTYDGETGKSRYGRYVCKSRQYVSYEGFLSYDSFVSPLFQCIFNVDAQTKREDELPCDEPPVDLDIPPLDDRDIFCQTTDDLSSFVSSVRVFGGQTYAEMADSFKVYPQINGFSYNLGVTYRFQQVPYTASEAIARFPATILL